MLAISDVHADAAANLEWLKALPAHPHDALILAGDISHDLNVIAQTLDILVARFRHVFYGVGNHELWAMRSLDGFSDHENSIEKYLAILELATARGAHVAPALLGEDGVDGTGAVIAIIPMHSWYHSSFCGGEADTNGMTAMMDGAVDWPNFLADDKRQGFDKRRCSFFASANRLLMSEIAPPTEQASAERLLFGQTAASTLALRSRRHLLLALPSAPWIA